MWDMKNILLNIPHSSIGGLFDNEIGGWPQNAYFMNGPVRHLTDWHTDMLFSMPSNNKVVPVVFPYSRFVCDVERLEDDPLEKNGQCIVYEEYAGFKRRIDGRIKTKLLQMRRDYLALLSSHILEDNQTVLVDCHSFSDPKKEFADICVGFNDDFSYSGDVINVVVGEFQKSGYRVAVNHPYSNSITPTKEKIYKSIMIEVNKRVYMNEEVMLLESNARQWMRWYGCLERIYNQLLTI